MSENIRPIEVSVNECPDTEILAPEHVKQCFLARVALQNNLSKNGAWSSVPGEIDVADIDAKFDIVAGTLHPVRSQAAKDARDTFLMIRDGATREEIIAWAGYHENTQAKELKALHTLIGKALLKDSYDELSGDVPPIKQALYTVECMEPFASVVVARLSGWTDAEILEAFGRQDTWYDPNRLIRKYGDKLTEILCSESSEDTTASLMHLPSKLKRRKDKAVTSTPKAPSTHTQSQPVVRPKSTKDAMLDYLQGSGLRIGRTQPQEKALVAAYGNERLTREQERHLSYVIKIGKQAQKTLDGMKETQNIAYIGDMAIDRESLKRQAAAGDEAFLHFLHTNRGLVQWAITHKYWSEVMRSGIPLNNQTVNEIIIDVIYDERGGLWHAIELFNPDNRQKASFGTYALYWIRTSMQDAIARRSPLHISKNKYDRMMKARRKYYFWLDEQRKAGRSVSPHDKPDDITPSDFALVKHSQRTFVSTSEPLSNREEAGDGSTINDTLRSTEPDIGNTIAEKLYILEILEELTPREQVIITRTFGLDDKPALEDAELATLCNLTVGAVKLHRRNALLKLRTLLKGRCVGIETVSINTN